jgi:hypothetical protein
VQSADEGAVQQRRECAGVDHEPGSGAVNGTVDVKIEPFAHDHGHALEPAKIQAGHATGPLRIHVQEKDLFLAVENGFGRKERVGTENAIGLLLVQHAGGLARATHVGQNHRYIDNVKRAEAEIVGNDQIVEGAVDLDLPRPLHARGRGVEAKIGAAL